MHIYRKFLFTHLFHSLILCVWMFCSYMHNMWRSEEYIRYSRTRVMVNLWADTRVLEFNPSLLQEHILLPAEPSLWPQKINDLCTPIKSLNTETKRLRSLQPVWATRRTLSENNPQKTKNKQKKSTVLTVPHLFSFLINHFHVKENYGAFCFMLKPCIWNQIMYLSNFPISLEVSIHYT